LFSEDKGTSSLSFSVDKRRAGSYNYQFNDDEDNLKANLIPDDESISNLSE